MTVLPVLQQGDRRLHQPSRSVGREWLALPQSQAFLDDLVETMRHARGIGLSAVQVGVSVRAIAIECDNNPRYPSVPTLPLEVWIDPKIEPVGTETNTFAEGCLSVPDRREPICRPSRIRLRALDRHGHPVDRILDGFSARIVQHEVDHLDGLLFVDRLNLQPAQFEASEFDVSEKASSLSSSFGLVARD